MTYAEYYAQQAGSGLSGFSGIRQNGRGIWGTIWRRVAWPLLKRAGKQAIQTGLDIGRDAVNGGDFKQMAKTRLKDAGGNMVDEAASFAKRLIQGGEGRRKRKGRSVSRVPTKRRRKQVVKRKRKSTARRRKRVKT